MPEGLLCNKTPVDTVEQLQALLADKSGKQYYEEMLQLEVDAPALWATLQKTLKSRLRNWLSICAHCGMCADSCFFYLANGNDPSQVPSYKIQETLGEMVRRKGRVDNAFMRNAMDAAYSKCTCCNRCGLYCPFGIDTGVMFSYLRGLLFSQGFVPWEMKIGSGMHRIYRAQMDVTSEDWVETCSWMFAGENWTVPSKGWEETSMAMFSGGWAGCKQQVEEVYAAMERLKPKRMVVTECGHAYRATVIEGRYWAGRKSGKTPIDSFHYVEWVAEALRTGKLKIDPAKRIKEPVTYQDSCNYIRNGGLREHAREIMRYIAEDFREMKPCGEHNFCCGGGGGLNGIGRYREQRNIGLKVKRDQILATGAKLVVTPCHNCWDAVRDLEEHFHIGIRWSFLKPLLLKMVVVPEHLRPEE
ncbi:MAG: (Fe-S)-binding protein [Desulfatitalea sp.]|nr:(Fe-S)-binding protein [Desulfatitalea sp.]